MNANRSLDTVQRSRAALAPLIAVVVAFGGIPNLTDATCVAGPRSDTIRIADTDVIVSVPAGWHASDDEGARTLVKQIPMQLRNSNLALQVHVSGVAIDSWRRFHRDKQIDSRYPGGKVLSENEIANPRGDAVLFHVIGLGGSLSDYELYEALVALDGRWVTASLLFDRQQRAHYEGVIRDVVASMRVDAAAASAMVDLGTSRRAGGSDDPDHRRGRITWREDLDAALREAKRRDVPLMVAIHHESQPVCRTLRETHYRDEEIIELSRNMVVLLADASAREDGGDRDGVSSAACQIIEQDVRQRYFDTGMPVAPQHLFLSSDGELVVQREYMLDVRELRRLMRQAIADGRGVTDAAKLDLIREPLALYRAADSAAARGRIVEDLLASGRFQAIDHLIDGITRRSSKAVDVQEFLIAIGNSRRPEGVAIADRLLAHRTWQFRQAAADALAAIGDESAIDALLEALSRERQTSVRGSLLEAAAVCGRKSPAIVERILAFAERGSVAARVEAIIALRHFPGDGRVAEQLSAVLEKGSTAQLRAAAAWSLAWFDDPRVDAALAEAAERGRRGKYAAVFDTALRHRAAGGGAANEHQACLHSLRGNRSR